MTGGNGWSREQAQALATRSGHPPLDLSLGVPADPPPALANPAPAPPAGPAGPAAYPPSAGRPELLAAAGDLLRRRYGVTLPAGAAAACAGAKEFIASAPLFLGGPPAPGEHRGPPQGRRDTVLIPALGYPPYEFGARAAGLRPYRVPVDGRSRMDVSRLPGAVVSRALCLWVNSPANPTGVIEPLGELAQWGRENGVPVLSDEAYAETTWRGEPASVLQSGLDGVLAVHSVSKRSNAPGLRVGFYAGDPRLVARLVTRRRAAGLIAAASSQAAAVRLLGDDAHAAAQRDRTARRLSGLVALLNAHGFSCPAPPGGLFVWLPVPGGNGLDFARTAALTAGLLVTPGIEYGPSGAAHVRIAAVRDPELIAPRIAMLAGSMTAAGNCGRMAG
jgi:aspartate/methionine/tyrosine aminotransferase